WIVNEQVVIIGAGMAGLTAARLLRMAGFKPLVLDKGRRPGGRMASRVSRQGHTFDHGAQFISAETTGFQAVLTGAMTTSSLAVWRPGPAQIQYVGVPTMVDFALHLSRAIDVRQNIEVTGIEPDGSNWRVLFEGGDIRVPRLILAIPAPQAEKLLGAHPFAAEVAKVSMAPCLTLMAAYSGATDAPYPSRRDNDDDLAWIAHDSSKPEREPGARFVAQASEKFSWLHLEKDKDAFAALMLPLLSEALGRDPKDAVFTAGHRWRYARAVRPLGVPCLADESASLLVGGDWCLGETVEAAWESGVAMAERVILS
ncbi:MAG: FAD-dependent oxidoreductase, partial [Pseudomonadota bacterium]